MMRLKVYAIIITLILTIGGVVSAETPVNKETIASEAIGRYQLFQGTYTTFDLKRQQTFTATAIFLIDTKTGVVKRYINKIDEEGKYIETWSPTEISEKR